MVSWGELFSTFLVRKIMRVEGTCRSPNGGVVTFCRLSIYPDSLCPLCLHLLHAFPASRMPPESGCSRVRMPAGCSRVLLPESSPLPSIVADFQTIRAKRGKNEFLFGGRWCFLGKIGDNRGRNLNIFLKSRKEGGLLRWSVACLLACPLVAGV